MNDEIKLKFLPPLFPHGKWFPISIRFERDYVIPPLPLSPLLLYFLLIAAFSLLFLSLHQQRGGGMFDSLSPASR